LEIQEDEASIGTKGDADEFELVGITDRTPTRFHYEAHSLRAYTPSLVFRLTAVRECTLGPARVGTS
jgi:hypothetical protein